MSERCSEAVSVMSSYCSIQPVSLYNHPPWATGMISAAVMPAVPEVLALPSSLRVLDLGPAKYPSNVFRLPGKVWDDQVVMSGFWRLGLVSSLEEEEANCFCRYSLHSPKFAGRLGPNRELKRECFRGFG